MELVSRDLRARLETAQSACRRLTAAIAELQPRIEAARARAVEAEGVLNAVQWPLDRQMKENRSLIALIQAEDGQPSAGWEWLLCLLPFLVLLVVGIAR